MGWKEGSGERRLCCLGLGWMRFGAVLYAVRFITTVDGGVVVLRVRKKKVGDSSERHDFPARNRAWGRAWMAKLRSNTLRFVRSAISNDIAVLSTISTSSYSTTG